MPKHQHRRFTLPKMNKKQLKHVQWTANSSKIWCHAILPTLPFGLESFAFFNRCSAGALEAPLDQIGHLGNSSKSLAVFLGVRNHIFTVTRLFVLLFCLFALNHGGIEVKCRWITHRGKQHFAMNFPVSHSSCNCWVSWSQPNCVQRYKHNKPVHSTRVICHWWNSEFSELLLCWSKQLKNDSTSSQVNHMDLY